MNIKYKLLPAIITLCSSLPASAVEQIEVQALMPGMAVVNIDGERRTLKQGRTEKDGIRLISADTRSARIEIDGLVRQYQMGTRISASFKKRTKISERIVSNSHGMYLTHGSINGQSVRLLVDTGASTIAMSSAEAKRLGIQYRLDGIETKASTASGIADAWRIKLKSVKLGGIAMQNVTAMVIDGNHPRYILLGMSFLDKLKVSKEHNLMILEQKR